MIYLILGLLIMAGIIFFLFKSNRKKGKEISKLDNRIVELIATVAQRDHIIKGMEVINRETAKKKKKLRTGNDTDNFNNSLDILSELPADPD